MIYKIKNKDKIHGIKFIVISSLQLKWLSHMFCLSFWKQYKQGVLSHIFILKTWAYAIS
jgi:hypothetical protein